MAATVADPLSFEFQDGNGGTVFGTVNTGLTINTNGVGASLGSSNGVPFRFWLVVFYNAGVPVLGLVNCSGPNNIYPLIEKTSPAVGQYSLRRPRLLAPSTRQMSLPLLLLYLRYWDMWESASGLTTAGTYASGPTSTVHVTAGTKSRVTLFSLSMV